MVQKLTIPLSKLVEQATNIEGNSKSEELKAEIEKANNKIQFGDLEIEREDCIETDLGLIPKPDCLVALHQQANYTRDQSLLFDLFNLINGLNERVVNFVSLLPSILENLDPKKGFQLQTNDDYVIKQSALSCSNGKNDIYDEQGSNQIYSISNSKKDLVISCHKNRNQANILESITPTERKKLENNHFQSMQEKEAFEFQEFNSGEDEFRNNTFEINILYLGANNPCIDIYEQLSETNTGKSWRFGRVNSKTEDGNKLNDYVTKPE